MKKKDIKYVVILGSVLFLFILIELAAPKPIDWSITLEKDHKIPFGTYALNQTMTDLFPGQSIEHYNQSVYDLSAAVKPSSNIFILSNAFAAQGEDADALLEMAENGSDLFIAANFFQGDLADTLGLFTGFSFFRNLSETERDSTTLYLADKNYFNTGHGYNYLLNHVSQYFVSFDSAKAEPLAINDDEKPVLIRVKRGKGNIYFCSTPLAFTNYYLLREDNDQFVSSMLSYLPVADLHWTNYYHVGRLEARTPLRFILSQPPLKWAYFIIIGAIALFMMFEAKRKQRIIPVVKPPLNTTLDFIHTVSALYIKESNNKNIAQKGILYLLDFIRANYNLSTERLNDDFYLKLARKSGKDVDKIRKLFAAIDLVRQKAAISGRELMALNREIEDFYNH